MLTVLTKTSFRCAGASVDPDGLGILGKSNLGGKPNCLGFRTLKPIFCPISPVSYSLMWEVWYRWWEGKGDVWRLLQDMAVTIDGRTWPAEEEAHVRPLPLGSLTIANLQRVDRM